MILLIDAGNTRIKWGWWAGGQWRDHGYVGSTTPVAVERVFAFGKPDWVVVCCVANEGVREELAAAIDACGAESHWVRSKAEGHGINNCYTCPAQLGADRYAALVASRRLGHAPCVVASIGTALTVDALSGQGEFLGGMILPGAGLMRQAVHEGTAQVGFARGAWAEFPRNTGDAVESGIWAAMAGVVERMRMHLVAHEGRAVESLVTGGDAATLVSHLTAGGQVIQGLVLEGLLWIARDMEIPGA